MTTAAAAVTTQGMVTEAARCCPECNKASPNVALCQYMQLRFHASCSLVSLSVSGDIDCKGACRLTSAARFSGVFNAVQGESLRMMS